ncbi:MAG: calcium-binding protein [Planctomycetota bacterium]
MRFCLLTPLTALLLGSLLSQVAFGQTLERVTLDSAGAQANDSSRWADVSADGRFIVFASVASNLVPGDTNNAEDIFVRDRRTGTTERVSVDSSGIQGNSTSRRSSISEDGRYVGFVSYATDLVPGDTNNALDAFVHDRNTGATIRISVDSSGNQGNGPCREAPVSFSADSRFAAFTSAASDLVPGDTNGAPDSFVYELATGQVTRISVSSSGVEGNAGGERPALSGDGRYVAFDSSSSDLVSGDFNSQFDIFVHDRQTGTTIRASLDSSGGEGFGPSFIPSISSDGQLVAFQSSASSLVTGDTNGSYDAFVRDLSSGTTTRVSVDSSGIEGDSHSRIARISGDGRFVSFESSATNLVPSDTNGVDDILVHDLSDSSTTRLSLDESGQEAALECALADLSSGGRFVVFETRAALVADDTNDRTDIYVIDRLRLQLDGTPQGGSNTSFTLSQAYGHADNKMQVLISCTGTAPGFPIPGGQWVPLVPDACLTLSLDLQPLLSATIDATEAATTLTVPFPAAPPGLVIHAAALIIELLPTPRFVGVSAPLSITTQ